MTLSFFVRHRFAATAFAMCMWILAPASSSGESPVLVGGKLVVKTPLRLSAEQSDETIQHVTFDAATYRQLQPVDHVVLSEFPLGLARTVDLELHRVEVFTSDAQIVAGTVTGDIPLPRPDVVILGGHVKGSPGSLAFLSLSPSGSNGLIELNGDTYVVASPRRNRATDTVVYNLAALPAGAIQWTEWTCAMDRLLPLGAPGVAPAPLEAENEGETTGRVASSLFSRRAVLAIETDWEFTGTLFGGDTNASGAYAATLIGAISEIYVRDVDTQLQIGFLRLWEDSNDPWTASQDTADQLLQFRSYWNSQMTHVARHAAHFLSGRGLGGGIAYLQGLCATNYDYGLSANLNGYFPYPLEDNHPQNWDIMVVAHELGHNFGAPHTHDMTPPIDNCAYGDCSVTPHGTIMSYCHTCSGGMRNIELHFHPRIIDEQILPYIESGVDCDLSAGPSTCTSALPPTPAPSGATNRYLSLVPGNAGEQTALRVTFLSLPTPFDVLDGTTMWVGQPEEVSENASASNPLDAPGFPTFWAATLVCDAESAFKTDWTTYGTVYVHHAGIVPGGSYLLQAANAACDLGLDGNYSFGLTFDASRRGDIVKDCTDTPCAPADGLVGLSDALAILKKFSNTAGAPIKARTDLMPYVPDHRVDLADLTAVLQGFAQIPYPGCGFCACPDFCGLSCP